MTNNLEAWPEPHCIAFASIEDRKKGEQIINALVEALAWEEEYRTINNLVGSSCWVDLAKTVLNSI